MEISHDHGRRFRVAGLILATITAGAVAASLAAPARDGQTIPAALFMGTASIAGALATLSAVAAFDAAD